MNAAGTRPGIARGAGQVWVLLWKDLMIDLRRKENLVAMFLFALLTLLIFNFAVGESEISRYRITPIVRRALEAEGVSQADLARLDRLLGRTFSSRDALLKSLDRLDGLAPESRAPILTHSGRGFLRESAAGLLWVTIVLAGVLGLSKSFALESDQGCMDGLLLTPVNRGVLYIGKMLGNTLFLGMIQAGLLPLFSLMFGIGMEGVWLPLAAVMAGGTLGFTALGTLLGGITATLRGHEVLLPILLFPLLVPLLVVVVHLTGVVLDGESLAEQWGWLRMMIAFDVIYLTVSFLVFEYVLES